MKYSDEVLRRVRQPARVGSLDDGEGIGTGEVGTLNDGTVTRIQVRVAGTTVTEARFKVFGCSAAIASASLVTEWLEGAAIDEARQITAERVVQRLALSAEREPVARMAVQAAHQALVEATAAAAAEGRR